MKKRLLCLMASLLLCGAAIAQEPAYVREHDNNMPVVAQVVLDEVPVTTSEWTLKAYIGDDQRGEAVIQTSLNYTYWIQVYYDTPATGQTNPVVSFKITNGTDVYVTETTLEAIPEGHGTPGDPQVLNFTSTQMMTQTTALAAGWSWWSTPIEITNGSDALTMLENSLGNSCIRIQSKSGYLDYIEFEGMSFWDGNITGIANEQMYKISTSAVSSVTMTGYPANPSQHSITISNGWNWIGFPSSSSMSLDNAMSNFTPEPEDVIKGKNGYAQYIVFEDFSFWDGNLTTLQPGQGYMYQSNSNEVKYLTYPQVNRNNLNEDNEGEVVGNSFMTMGDNYANNMTITAVIDLDGSLLCSDDYELAAFVGNECRGSIKLKYVKPLNQYMAFLLVHGDKEESLRFALTDGNEISWSNDYLMYANDATYGTPTQPVVLHFGPIGVNESSIAIINIYPNPSHDVFNIEGKDIQKVEVINAFGQIIYSKEINNNSLQIDLSKHAIGAYLVRVVTSKGINTQQVIKK